VRTSKFDPDRLRGVGTKSARVARKYWKILLKNTKDVLHLVLLKRKSM